MIVITLVLCLVLGLLMLPRNRPHRNTALPCLHSSLELLESRIAPAALTAKLNAGVLSIVGDPATAVVLLGQTGTTVEVFDGFTSLGTFSTVKSIKMNLVGDADISANLSSAGIPGSMSVTTSGACTFTLATNSQIGGALSFQGNAAAQTLNPATGVLIGKALTFNGASGHDSFSFGEGVSLGGNATFISVENGTFNAATNLTAIGGALRFNNASTPLAVNITIQGATGLDVGGALTYAGGSSSDTVEFRGTLGGSASFVDKFGSNGFFIRQASIVRGSIKVLTGDGNDAFGIQSGNVEGSVLLKLGTGNNTFTYGIAGTVNIGGNLSMFTAAGDDTWQTFGGPINLNGNLTMKLGDGTNQLIASISVAGTIVNLTTGTGADSVTIDGSATNATLRVFLDAGNDSLAGSLFQNTASALFNGGPGLDRFAVNTLTTAPLIIISFEDFS
jgi:large repetitive protein